MRVVPPSPKAFWAAALLLAGALAARAEPIDPDVPLAEVAAYVQARSSFERHCYRCHTTAGDECTRRSLDLLDMSRYPFTGRRGPNAGRAIKRVLGGEGGKPTMPKDTPSAVTPDEQILIFKWADLFEAGRAPKERTPGPDAGMRPTAGL
jgi:hypothetical protein